MVNSLAIIDLNYFSFIENFYFKKFFFKFNLQCEDLIKSVVGRVET